MLCGDMMAADLVPGGSVAACGKVTWPRTHLLVFQRVRLAQRPFAQVTEEGAPPALSGLSKGSASPSGPLAPPGPPVAQGHTAGTVHGRPRKPQLSAGHPSRPLLFHFCHILRKSLQTGGVHSPQGPAATPRRPSGAGGWVGRAAPHPAFLFWAHQPLSPSYPRGNCRSHPSTL